MEKKRDSTLTVDRPIKVLIASEGSEEAALRATRLGWDDPSEAENTGFEAYTLGTDSILPATWLPRSRGSRKLLKILEASSSTRVADLFDVKQGAITGNNNAFFIGKDEYLDLPVQQRKYFRPVGGTPHIKNS
jgi:hypothetical protein